MVKDLHGLSKEDFLDRVSVDFEVTAMHVNGPYRPEKTHEIGMYLSHTWFRIVPRPGTWNKDNVVDSLDVSILQNNLLAPLLGIGDPRRDKRVDFIGGIRGLEELERRVDSDRDAVAFAMYPTSMDELISIADAGEIMPPKSTWFEPKLRSGLFIHPLQ